MTMRSHDQFNTTIYSDNDRYRGVKNLRTLLFMNEDDMRERGLEKFSLIDITSFAKDGSTRSCERLPGRALRIPRGCAAGYMPELNVLCPIGDFSPQSDQPLMKHLVDRGDGFSCRETGSPQLTKVSNDRSNPDPGVVGVQKWKRSSAQRPLENVEIVRQTECPGFHEFLRLKGQEHG